MTAIFEHIPQVSAALPCYRQTILILSSSRKFLVENFCQYGNNLFGVEEVEQNGKMVGCLTLQKTWWWWSLISMSREDYGDMIWWLPAASIPSAALETWPTCRWSLQQKWCQVAHLFSCIFFSRFAHWRHSLRIISRFVSNVFLRLQWPPFLNIFSIIKPRLSLCRTNFAGRIN